MELFRVDVEKIQRSHGNLCKPSTYSTMRNWFFNNLSLGGYEAVEKAMKRRDIMMSLFKKIIRKDI